MKFFNYLLFLLLLCACKQPASQVNNKTKGKYITGPVAVVITPSNRLINKLKKQYGEEYFNTIADDNSYYSSQSVAYLDSIKVRKMEHASEGAINFKTTSGKIYKMKLDTIFFGVLLFNGKDKPIEADMTDINTHYKQYMNK